MKLFTVVSQPHVKKTTSKDKSSSCNSNIQDVKSSKTLQAESTSKGRDLQPFWKDALKETYAKFTLPIVTDSVDSDSIFYKSCSRSMESNWWWKMTKSMPVQNKSSQETFSALVTSLAVELLPRENMHENQKKTTKRKGQIQGNGRKQNKMSKLSQEQISRMKEKTVDQKLKFMGLDPNEMENTEQGKDILELLYNDFIDKRAQELEQKFHQNPKSLKIADKRDLCALRGIPNPYGKKAEQLDYALSQPTNYDMRGKVITRTLKVRLLVRNKQHKIFNRWFGVCRKVYNNGVALLQKEKLSFEELVKRLVTTESLTEEERAYMLEVPTRVRKGAVEQLWDAFDSNIKKQAKNPDHTFTLKFRRYDAIRESMIIKKETLHLINDGKNAVEGGFLFEKTNGKKRPGKKFRGQDIIICPDSLFGKEEPLTISCKPFIIEKIRQMKLADQLCDMTLVRSKWVNRYWLYIPYKIVVPTTESFPEHLLTIDPGVRTFQTWYRSDGSFGKNGHEARQRLLMINKKISRLQSILDKMPRTSKNNTKEANNEIMKAKLPLEIKKRVLFLKKKDWITHCHYESMKELTSQEKTLILLPSFQVQQMITKKERKNGPLSKEVKQSMVDLSFYRFRCRLEHYLEKHHEKKCHLKIVTEEYTSKTCGKCGNLKNVSGDKYNCIKCKVVLDRDVNGARNILLKAITPLLLNM